MIQEFEQSEHFELEEILDEELEQLIIDDELTDYEADEEVEIVNNATQTDDPKLGFTNLCEAFLTAMPSKVFSLRTSIYIMFVMLVILINLHVICAIRDNWNKFMKS